jgi:hypothetical protein
MRLCVASDISSPLITTEELSLFEKQAVVAGSSADIFRASYRGQEVALKRLRIFKRGQERIKIYQVVLFLKSYADVPLLMSHFTGYLSRSPDVAAAEPPLCPCVLRIRRRDLFTSPVNGIALDASWHDSGIHSGEGQCQYRETSAFGSSILFASRLLNQPRYSKSSRVWNTSILKTLSTAICAV